jgi:hypothetical protein
MHAQAGSRCQQRRLLQFYPGLLLLSTGPPFVSMVRLSQACGRHFSLFSSETVKPVFIQKEMLHNRVHTTWQALGLEANFQGSFEGSCAHAIAHSGGQS